MESPRKLIAVIMFPILYIKRQQPIFFILPITPVNPNNNKMLVITQKVIIMISTKNAETYSPLFMLHLILHLSNYSLLLSARWQLPMVLMLLKM